jgi:hypothetical protein
MPNRSRAERDALSTHPDSADAGPFHDAVEAYLGEVRAHLLVRPSDTDRFIDEVRDHLREDLDHEDQSDTPTSAIARFGNPAEVGRALSAEHALTVCARTASRFAWWSVAIGVGMAIIARVTVGIAGARGIPTAEIAAIAVGFLAACCAGALSGWSVRTSRRIAHEPHALRTVIAANAASAVAAMGGVVAVIGLGSDLVADATRAGEFLVHLTAASITIVLAVVVGSTVSSLWRPWRTVVLEHPQSSLV